MPDITFIDPMRARISADLAAKIVGNRTILKRYVDRARPNIGQPIEKGATIYETRPHFIKLTVEPTVRGNHYFMCDTVPTGEYLIRTLAVHMTREQISALTCFPNWLREELTQASTAEQTVCS